MEGEGETTTLAVKASQEYLDKDVVGTLPPGSSEQKKELFAQKKRNLKKARRERKGPKPMSCKRPAKSLIHMAFNREHSVFEVTRKCKNYLAIMGVPLKNGRHLLFPEEVLYLMEHWSAYATDEGRTLTFYDGIRILGETGVPFYKYRAYSALRKAGFVVLRPDRSRVHSLPLQVQQNVPTEASSSRSSTVGISKYAYPKHLLDDFPTMQNSQLLVSSQLHRNKQLIPTEELSDFPYNPRGFRMPHKPLRDTRKLLRPAYWPDFDDIKSAVSSWREFALKRKESIHSAKRAIKARHQARSKEVRSEYDFEVFLSDRFTHSQPSTPAFRVICFDSRRGALSCAYTHHYAGDIPLMLSIFDCGYICFIEISGESIDLKEYLENLKKRSE